MAPKRAPAGEAKPSQKKARSGVERSPTPRAQGEAGRGAFKVLAWNVAGLRAALRGASPLLQRVVQAEAPDLVCLQEHKLQEKHVPEVEPELLRLLPGYDAHWACSAPPARLGYSGVVALVKRAGGAEGARQAFFQKASEKKKLAGKGPAITFGLGRPDRGYAAEGRAITAEYGDFFVVMVYVPNSGNELKNIDRRLGEWEADMRAYLRELDAKKPVVLVGDLNVAHLDADIWNCGAKHLAKSAGTSPQEREAFARLLRECDMVDTFRHLHPEAAGVFTYWSQRANNRPVNRGLRIDYAVASRRLVEAAQGPAVFDAFVLDGECNGLSDHCAVGCSLHLAQ